MTIALLLLAPAIMVAVVDTRSRRIPNVVIVPALIAVLALAAWQGTVGTAFAGMMIAGGAGIVMRLAARGEFGMGDVKLLAYGGAAVGPAGLTTMLAAAAVAGGVAGMLLLVRSGRDSTFPYGPAITLGIALALVQAH